MNFFNILFNKKYKHKGRFEEQLFASSGGSTPTIRVRSYVDSYYTSSTSIEVPDDKVIRCGYYDANSQKYVPVYVTDIVGENRKAFYVDSIGADEYILVYRGDANLDKTVSEEDRTTISDYTSEITTLTPEQMFAADANNDGRVTYGDSTRIHAYLLGQATLNWDTLT